MASLGEYQRQGSDVFLPEDVLNDLTFLYENGLKEESYRLVVSAVEDQGLPWDSRAFKWADYASGINGNDATFSNGWIRAYTNISVSVGNDVELTPDSLQQVSDAINESFIGGIIEHGGELPTLHDIIVSDAVGTTSVLGMDVHQWAGWLFGNSAAYLDYDDQEFQQLLGEEFWPDSFWSDLNIHEKWTVFGAACEGFVAAGWTGTVGRAQEFASGMYNSLLEATVGDGAAQVVDQTAIVTRSLKRAWSVV